jgi:hypothetical protein
MISEATVMSKPASRGKPLATPPSEQTISRKARSFMSMTRRQATRRWSMQAVAPVDVIVDERGEQIVRRGDGVEVAGEVEVDVFHRHDLGIAAAGGAALHAEARTERGLAQGAHRLLADHVQRVGEAHGRRRLAFARGRRRDRRHQNELAVLLVFQRLDVVERDLGLVVAVRLEIFHGDAELFLRHVGDAARLCGLGDFNVGLGILVLRSGHRGVTFSIRMKLMEVRGFRRDGYR